MDALLFKPTVWACPNCIYTQETDPHDALQQTRDWFPNVPLGLCPSCSMAGKGSYEMYPLPASDAPTVWTLPSDSDIEGATKFVLVPNAAGVIVQQEVTLTDEEIAARIDDRDRKADAWAAMDGVEHVTEG